MMEAMRTIGIAMTTARDDCIGKVVRAINNHPALEIKCDMSLEACVKRSRGFENRSSFGIFQYVTGAIDGLMLKHTAPKNVENQQAYMSGSKKVHCVNMQAVADDNRKFLAVSCKHTGNTNDCVAFDTSGLKERCQEHPFPYHWVGDPAYVSSETMMIPYPGTNLHQTDPHAESFNFYHSQVRICIECTFGIFMQRFPKLSVADRHDLDFFFEIVHACCRLHNFCIDRNSRMPDTALDVARGIHVPPLNASGGLEGREWYANTAAWKEEMGKNTYNALRTIIKQDLVEKNIVMIRSHHK
jgi:hypothetical protein